MALVTFEITCRVRRPDKIGRLQVGVARFSDPSDKQEFPVGELRGDTSDFNGHLNRVAAGRSAFPVRAEGAATAGQSLSSSGVSLP
jgi:hypothetical protein